MFCPGMLLALAPHLRAPRWRRLAELPRARWALPVAAVLLIVATLLGSTAPRGYGIHAYLLLTDACRPLFALGFGIVLAAALDARPWFQRRGRFALHLGLVSYGIYLIHAVALDALLEHGGDLIPLHHGGVLAYAVHLALLLAITIPLAMASWRWLEQPFIRLASRLSARWRAREGARAPSAVP
jgi:peptidoglycan/LPS O-acetylase OafA/YrhL